MSDSHAVHPGSVSRMFRRLATLTLHAFTLHRSRSRLGALDPHMLADIGLTPEQARIEATRPVWDAPSGWLNRE